MATQPPDFIPDDEVPDFVPDETTVQPPEAPGSSAVRFIGGAAKGAGRGALSLVNPVDWARAAKAAAILGYKLAKPPVLGQPYEGAEAVGDIVEGGKEAVRQALTSPEAAGEFLGSAAVSMLGPGVVARSSRGIASILRRSRAQNIVRAVKGPDELAKALETSIAAGGEPEIPIAVTQGSLARKLRAAEEAAGAEVGAAAERLPGSVPSSAVAERMPTVGINVGGTPVNADPSLMSAVERTRRRWNSLGEAATPETIIQSPLVDEFGNPILHTVPARSAQPLNIPRSQAPTLKTEAGGAAERGGAFRKGALKMPMGAGAEASAAETSAIRGAILDRTGLSPEDIALVDAYEKALARDSYLKSVSNPAQAEHLRRVRGEAGDWKAGLMGRAAAYGMLGGGGGLALGPVGALGGIGAAEFMRSTLWRTLSAATKLRAARALESGGLAAFQDVIAKSVVPDVQRRRMAERALRAQGEGVTAP